MYVRINRSPHLYSLEDILAVVGPQVEGIMISKPIRPEDVQCASMMLAEAESRNGVALGSTRITLLRLEIARAAQSAYEIALLPRVGAIVGATAKERRRRARSARYGRRTGARRSYLKSRAVMAARAAGKLPIGGVWQQIHDPQGLRKSSQNDRALGMSGEPALHPSNVPVINEIYTPSPEQVAFYEGMVDALDKAVAEGRASCVYDGEHIDIAPT